MNIDLENLFRVKFFPLLAELFGRNNINEKYNQVKKKLLVQLIGISLFSVVASVFSKQYVYGIVLILGLPVLIIYFTYDGLKKKVLKRRERIGLELPAFILRMVLLIECGITLFRAFELSSRQLNEKSILKKIANECCNEVHGGKSERYAYEKFAIECKTVEASRFSSMLMQNIQKGNSDLGNMLRITANESMGNRKYLMKRRAERLSMQLLMPLMLLLLAVITLAVAPAVFILMEGI